jgi:ribose transport system substrate-binding protein
MKSLRLAVLALTGLVFAACGGSSEPTEPGRLRVAVIPKGTTHEFWKAIHAGALRAAEELDVEVIWKGPLKENDRAEQIKVVEQFAAQGVDGIALAPLDYKALVRPVQTAMQRQTPVVIFDSALEGEPGKDFAAFVATDNLEGGRMAARALLAEMGGKGKVVMLRYQVGSASTNDRENGFLEVMQDQGDVQILSSDQFAGASVESAKTKALNMLDVLREADGIFCPNESVTVGMLRALEQENLTEGKAFVGFDATPVLVEALRKGAIRALVVQDPVDMGYRAVKSLVAAIRGETVEPKVDTRVAVATPANLDEPDVAKLLK